MSVSISKTNVRSQIPSIRTDEFKRRTASRVGLWFVFNVLVAGLSACIYRLLAHHWPNIGWPIGCLLYLMGTVLFKAAIAYQEIIALLDRQNTLLERLLEQTNRAE
jgi:hypothetical protein